jgi:hypothetical protein
VGITVNLWSWVETHLRITIIDVIGQKKANQVFCIPNSPELEGDVILVGQLQIYRDIKVYFVSFYEFSKDNITNGAK